MFCKYNWILFPKIGKIVEVEIQKTNKQTMFGKIVNQFKTKEEFAA